MNAVVNSAIVRAAELENRKILHPRFTEAMRILEESYLLSVESGKPRAIMVLGESGVGKSTLLAAFLANHPRQEARQKTIIPVLAVEVPAQPTIKSTADAILMKFNKMYVSGSAEAKTERIKLLLKQCDVRCLILDEFQHIVDRGRTRMNAAVADWLKNLMNSSGISVMAFGLPQSANLLRYNEQLRRRFSSSITLSPWTLESEADFNEFRAVINAFERAIALNDVSNLYAEDIAKRIYFATDGKIGYLSRLLSSAMYKVLLAGETCIQRQHLHAAFREQIWADASEQTNPFSDEFQLRRLNRKAEPYEPPLV